MRPGRMVTRSAMPSDRACRFRKYRRLILANDDQPRSRFQCLRKAGQRIETAIEPLGLEAGTDLQEEQIFVGQRELTAEVGADCGGVGRRPPVCCDARRQQVETLLRRAGSAFQRTAAAPAKSSESRSDLLCEYSALVGSAEMAVTGGQAIQRIAQCARLFLRNRVSGEIDASSPASC